MREAFPYMIKAVELHRAFRKLGEITLPSNQGLMPEHNYRQLLAMCQQADLIRSKMICPVCNTFHYEEEKILSGMTGWDCEKSAIYIRETAKQNYHYLMNKPRLTLDDNVKINRRMQRLVPVFRRPGETDDHYLSRMMQLASHVKERRKAGHKNLFFDSESYELSESERKIVEEIAKHNGRLTEQEVLELVQQRLKEKPD